MYVCVCNALTERHVEDAVNRGARSVSNVYRAHGCKAQCGKCTCQVRDMIREHRPQLDATVTPAPTLVAVPA